MHHLTFTVILTTVLAIGGTPARGDDMSDYDAIKTTIYNYFDGIRQADRLRKSRRRTDAGQTQCDRIANRNACQRCSGNSIDLR